MRTIAKKLAALILATAILASNAPAVFADFDLEAGGNAVVAYTGGESVKVRAGTGTDFDVITTAPEGAVVTIVAGPFESLDGTFWYGLSYQGTIGYIMADFLALPGNAPSIPVTAASSPISGGGGYTSIITGTGGDGARIRDGASIASAVVIYAVENAQVKVIGSPLNSDGYAWYPVSYLGYVGWVAGDFLGSGSAEMPVVAQTATPAFELGAHVQVSGTGGDDLRIRESYGLDGSIVGHAGPGEVLAVLDGPFWDAVGNGWYAVDYDGVSGYASAGFLNWTSSGLTARSIVAASVPAPAAPAPAVAAPAVAAPAPAPVPAQVSAPAPAPPSNTGRSQSLVNVAMRYLGYSYAWGGSSPSGFDCSGFTKYVAGSALGVGLGRTVASQIGAGTAINPKNLEPGDLVFFVNTYEAGLSHVGIYIGGGQMIHAGSERTGVVISNIWDSYWGPKFYAARRL